MPVEVLTDREAPAVAGASSLSGGTPGGQPGSGDDDAPGGQPGAGSGPLLLHLCLRPHRSMGQVGLAWLLLLTWIGFLIPLLAFLGTSVLWGLLPFALAALGALWWFMHANFREAELREEVWLTPGLLRVERREPRRPPRDWEANPYWVQVRLTPTGGPVPNYLTLRGNGREIELGAFLTPEERSALRDRLLTALRRAKGG